MLTENKGNEKGIEEMGTASTKEAIKKALFFIMANAFDEETRQATEEMKREREKAINYIVEEQKVTIRQIIENEKKAIWESVLDVQQPADFGKDIVKEILNQSLVIGNSALKPVQRTINPTDNIQKAAVSEEKVELEILPPRDQNEIATINTYLINMLEMEKVELVNMVDKSIFKIVMKPPIDLAAKLNSLPQVVNAIEVNEDGHKKIMITLLAKSKLERNNNLMNDKVNEIFAKKKR